VHALYVRIFVTFTKLSFLAILATGITGSPWDICNEMGSAFKEYVHDDPSVKTNIFVVDYPGNVKYELGTCINKFSSNLYVYFLEDPLSVLKKIFAMQEFILQTRRVAFLYC
jgi:hypothetical protein